MASSRTRSKNPTPLFCGLPLRGPLFGTSKRVRRRRRKMMHEKLAEPESVYVSLSSDEDEDEEEEDQVFSVSLTSEETYEDVIEISGSGFGAETERKQRSRKGLKGKRVAEMKGSGLGAVTEEKEKQRSRSGFKGKKVAEMKGSGFETVTEEKQRRRSDLKGKRVAEMKGSGFEAVTEEKQRRRSDLKGKRVAEPDVMFMGECEDKGEVGSGFGSKRKRESVVCIEISDVDDDDDDSEMGKQGPVRVAVNVKEDTRSNVKGKSFGNGRKNRREHFVVVSSSENAESGGDGGESTEDDVVELSKKKRFQGGVDGGERDDKSEGDKMCYEFDDEEGGDCGWVPCQPIVINLDGNENEDESIEAQSGSADGDDEGGDDDVEDDDDEVQSSSESEDDNSGDEDYRVDEVTASDCESSSSYESSDENENVNVNQKQRGRYRCSGCFRPATDQPHEDKEKQNSCGFHHDVLSQKRTRDSTDIDDSERVENSEGNSPIADDNDCVIEKLDHEGGGDLTKVDNGERDDSSERNCPISDANDSVIGDLGTQEEGDSTKVDDSESNSPISDVNDSVIGKLGTHEEGDSTKVDNGERDDIANDSPITDAIANDSVLGNLGTQRGGDSAEVDNCERVENSGRNSPIAGANDSVIGSLGCQGEGDSPEVDNCERVDIANDSPITDAIANDSVLGNLDCQGGGDSAEVDNCVRVENSGRNSPIAGANDSVIGSLGCQGEGDSPEVDNCERVDNSGRNSPIADANDSVIGNFGTQGGGGEHDDKIGFEEKDDDTHQAWPPAYWLKPPLKQNFKEAEPLEKSESEEGLDNLWDEMDLGLRSDDKGSVDRIASSLPSKQHKKGGKSAKLVDANNRVNANLGTQGGEEHHGKGSVVRNVSSLPRNQDKMGGKSTKPAHASDRVNVNHGKGSVVRNISSLPRKRDKMGGESAELAHANDDSVNVNSTQGGGEEHHGKNGFGDKDDVTHQVDTRPSAYAEKPPLKRNFKEAAEPLEKLKSEEGLDNLWAEMDLGIRSEDKGSVVRNVSSLPRKQHKMGGRSAKPAHASDRVNVNHGKGSVVRNIFSLPRKQDKVGGKSSELADADDDSVNVNGTQGGEDLHGKGSVARNVSSLPGKQEKMGESAEHKIGESGRRVHQDQINSSNHEKKAWVDKSIGHKDGHHELRRMPLKRKEQRLLDLLAECLLGKQKETKGHKDGFEEKEDDIHQEDTGPAAFGEKPPLKWNFKEPEPLKKSKSDEELDKLWDEMNLELRSGEVNSQVGNIGKNEARENQTFICKHDFRLDEEIGIICRLCSWVATEIRHVFPPVVDDYYPSKGSRKRVLSGVDTVKRSYDDAQFNVSDGDKDTISPQSEGTVWDLIPDIKQTLYPHQQEGFEFIWMNLAGTMDRQSLKTSDPCREGGCIISHAPGTGKTRLTMVFLQTYLEVFPKCRPVIIAPSNILLTWEDEFKKWDIGVPFHNLNNLELSGREQLDAIKEAYSNGPPQNSKDAVRMAKLYSWYKEKSILGISYQLFEKLAGGRNIKKKNRNKRKVKKHASMEDPEAETSVMGKVLLEIPGLLVLDEGHTPRNEHSSIWNVLSSIQTQKRIILSGTPFQNNFVELYNTICLVKPSFPNMIPPELRKFCQSRLMQEKKASEGASWEPVSSGNKATGKRSDEKIKQLKRGMDPFVHVHKGSILRENLPGLRDCVLILKPNSLQKEILESIENCKMTFLFEYKVALASVHPSLFLCCSLTEKEKSVVDRDQLEKLRLDPWEGAKTRFLVEFVRLCDSVNEKVLVFSQFIDPLKLIMDHLKSILDWREGKEVLYMSGKLDHKKKQHLIHGFNNDSSKAKVLLASTKACSEGINLVGASRVVLLDVVWNPSVERQAISRAYRIGQKKVVYTYHLITQDTPESAKYCKQAEKDRLSELVFSDPNAGKDGQKSGAVNIEDKILDQMIHHDKLKDLFGDCVMQPKEKDLIESFGFE